MPHEDIEHVASELVRAYRLRRTVYLFGNGGSAALASHFACDLAKGTRMQASDCENFRAMSLTDNVAVMTAWANDTSYEEIFAQQIQTFVSPGDIAFAISASGNSPNVLLALEMAKASRAFTIGLGGFDGGRMKMLCDASVIIPSDNMQVVEDFQLSVAHALFNIVRHRMAKPTAKAVSASIETNGVRTYVETGMTRG
jgi:D-sedoheptulose 7-phosphate isomerase